ncbi:MAG: fumarate hydratase C-terminal domain-containing protein [Lachnospiraceae bacterium]|nr:fumarate hydratase C-terminal domain-containing protein [Lachnospiraceae bacterium]
MDFHITLPFTEDDLNKIKPMDVLYLTGTVYTARDAAHKRMYEAVLNTIGPNNELNDENIAAAKSAIPFDITDAVVYYLGPTPARPGQVIGSAGPTTSGRMDKYTPVLLDLGLKGMIGKGRRSDAVTESIHKNKAIYMGATGGAGALLSKCIKSSEVVAYEDLGTEAIRKLYVEDFPVTVLIK